MGYPPGYRPRSRDLIFGPLPEAHPAICVCSDAQHAYERGWIGYEELVELFTEWLPRVPLGPAHGSFVAFAASVINDRVTIRRMRDGAA